MSLLFKTLSRFVIGFLLRSSCLLISWLQSSSTVILELKKRFSLFPPFPFLFLMKWCITAHIWQMIATRCLGTVLSKPGIFNNFCLWTQTTIDLWIKYWNDGFMSIVCSFVQSSPTLFKPMDCSSPCSSIRVILQAKILEWIAISFSRSFWSREWTMCPKSPALAGRIFTTVPPGKP